MEKARSIWLEIVAPNKNTRFPILIIGTLLLVLYAFVAVAGLVSGRSHPQFMIVVQFLLIFLMAESRMKAWISRRAKFRV